MRKGYLRYITRFKTWYEQRSTRERLFVIFLTWCAFYGIFYFIFLIHIEHQEEQLNEEIKHQKQIIRNWTVEINAVKNLANTPIYKQWKNQQLEIKQFENLYKQLLKEPGAVQGQEINQTLLQANSNIKIQQIKNYPPLPFHINDPRITIKILQQPLIIEATGTYFDTIDYLKYLEKSLPDIRWTSLNYQVTDYPFAKIQLELSILYDATT